MTGRKIGTISLVVFCAAAFIEAASIDEILEYRSLGQVVAAPDGRWAALVATHANFESNVLDSNIWVVDLETGEGSHNAKTPSLIQHGEEDVRVPLSQGTAFYRA